MKKVVFALALFLTPTLVFANGTPRSASQEDLHQYTSDSKSSPKRFKRMSDKTAEETATKASTPAKKSFMNSFKEKVSSVVQRILKVIGVVAK